LYKIIFTIYLIFFNIVETRSSNFIQGYHEKITPLEGKSARLISKFLNYSLNKNNKLKKIYNIISQIKPTKHFTPVKQVLEYSRNILKPDNYQRTINFCKKNDTIKSKEKLGYLVNQIRYRNQKICLIKLMRGGAGSTTYLMKHSATLLDKDILPFFSDWITSQTELIQKTISNHIFKKNLSKCQKHPVKVLSIINLNSKQTSEINDCKTLSSKNPPIYKHTIKQMKNKYLSKLNDNQENLTEYVDRIINFYSKNKKSIRPFHVWNTLKDLGITTARKRNLKLSFYIFEKSLSYGVGSQKNQSLYYMIWASLVNQRSDYAKFVIKKYDLIKNFDQLNGQLKFWVAYTTSKNKSSRKSQVLFKKIIDENKKDFYYYVSIIKSGITPSRSLPYRQRVLASIENESEWKKLQKQILYHMKSIRIWSQSNTFKFVNTELEIINNISQKHQRPFYYRESVIKTASIINKDKNYLESFKVIYQNLDISVIGEDIKSLLFPRVYLDKIKKYSKTVDPIVILSLIRQESAFNPSALSPAGARGLMQVMPQTAKSINSLINKNDLFKSEKSIQIGTKYFEKLLNIYKGNIIYSLAAYNAGPRRVRQWDKKYFSRMNDNLLKIESIPFKETRNYVKLIYRNLFNYEELGEPSKNKFITMLSN